jgi:hypothetical protein
MGEPTMIRANGPVRQHIPSDSDPSDRACSSPLRVASR